MSSGRRGYPARGGTRARSLSLFTLSLSLSLTLFRSSVFLLRRWLHLQGRACGPGPLNCEEPSRRAPPHPTAWGVGGRGPRGTSRAATRRPATRPSSWRAGSPPPPPGLRARQGRGAGGIRWGGGMGGPAGTSPPPPGTWASCQAARCWQVGWSTPLAACPPLAGPAPLLPLHLLPLSPAMTCRPGQKAARLQM